MNDVWNNRKCSFVCLQICKICIFLYIPAEYKSLLVPGNKTEIQNFIKRATESTRIYVDISLPLLSMQLKDKGLYETIYNRVNNGLLLWEPSAPKPSTPVYDVHYSPFRNFDTEDPEIYRLCQSGIQHSKFVIGSSPSHDTTDLFCRLW